MKFHHQLVKFLKPSLVVLLCVGLSVFALYSLVKSYEVPSQQKLQENNYSAIEGRAFQGSLEKSRESAVQITSFAWGSPYFSTASCTYFTANDKYFVVTVMHALQGPCVFTTIVYKEEAYN